MKKRRHLQKGFTLIEVITVLILIGILAAYAVPKMSSLTDSAREATAKSAISAVKSSIAAAAAKALIDGNGVTTVSEVTKELLLTYNEPNSNNTGVVPGDDYLKAGDFAVKYDIINNSVVSFLRVQKLKTNGTQSDAAVFEDYYPAKGGSDLTNESFDLAELGITN